MFAVALAGAFTVSTLPGVRQHDGFSVRLDGVLSNAAYLTACGLALLRSVRADRDRRAWLLLTAALTVYEVATMYWQWRILPQNPQPFPSLADAL